jgi:hypothetical protein
VLKTNRNRVVTCQVRPVCLWGQRMKETYKQNEEVQITPKHQSFLHWILTAVEISILIFGRILKKGQFVSETSEMYIEITNKCLNSYQFIVSLCCSYMFRQLCAILRELVCTFWVTCQFGFWLITFCVVCGCVYAMWRPGAYRSIDRYAPGRHTSQHLTLPKTMSIRHYLIRVFHYYFFHTFSFPCIFKR